MTSDETAMACDLNQEPSRDVRASFLPDGLILIRVFLRTPDEGWVPTGEQVRLTPNELGAVAQLVASIIEAERREREREGLPRDPREAVQ